MNTKNLAPPSPFVSPADPLAQAAHIAGAVRFSQLVPENIRWLWPNRIPLGRITLLVSDPGLGKSLLTLDIAARVSTGREWPDEERGAWSEERGEKPILPNSKPPAPSSTPSAPLPNSKLPAPSSVLLLTAEDDFADTVRPRLEALGADLDRILGIASWGSFSETAIPDSRRDSATRAFTLKRDLARLRNLLDSLPDCRLIVIDPISAYLGSTNADLQSLLLGLAAIARERNVAILIVSHLRKKEGAAIYRTMGSLAFVAAARAVWALCKDPEDERGRFFLPIKNNLAPTATGLAFTIESQNGMPQLHWSPDPVTHSIDFAFAAARSPGRPNEERQHAVEWLRTRLSTGPRAAAELKEEASACGITHRTLCRAFRELGGEAVHQGSFPIKRWHWQLPGVTCQNPGGEFWQVPNSDIVNEILNSLPKYQPHPTTTTLPQFS